MNKNRLALTSLTNASMQLEQITYLEYKEKSKKKMILHLKMVKMNQMIKTSED